MKINLISDLHLEFADMVLPGGDILILAGDVCEAKNLKKDQYDPNLVMTPKQDPTQRLDRFYRFFEEECARKYHTVIYVMGNHEHYGYQFHKTYKHIKEQLPPNVYLLENETLDIEDVTFVGATLWTDMNNNDWHTIYHAKKAMNDYRQVTMLNEAKQTYHRLIPEHTILVHDRSKAYIRDVVTNHPTRKYVVVTHHAPTKASLHPRYINDVLMNGSYSSDLSEFILDNSQIKAWVHGHTHDSFDYMVGTTRILCNPRGYAGYESRADSFNVNFSFDV